MEHVKPWMLDVILKDLDKVLQWRDVGDNLQKNSHTFVGGPHFEDDGGDLRIRPTKAEQIARISKFPHKDKPVRAVLSDSETRINVVFELEATNASLEKSRRDIHNEKLGALVQLVDYEISATAFAPRASQLTLVVKDFNLLGGDGSKVIGAIPRAIEDLPGSKELLRRLQRQNQQKDASTSKAASTTHSSPASSVMQSPFSGAKRKTHAKSNGNLPLLASQVPLVHSRSLGIGSKTGFNANRGTDFQSANGIPSKNTDRLSDEALKAGIWKKKVPQAHSTVLNGDRIDDEETPGPQTLTSMQTLLTEPRHAVANVAQFESGVSPNNQIAADKSDLENLEAVPRLDSAVLQTKTKVRGSDFNPAGLLKDQGVSILRAPASTSSSRARSGKITMKDIRMPKDQEYLLEQPHSWIPTELGRATLEANVPSQILKMLNTRAERRVKRGVGAVSGAEIGPDRPRKMTAQVSDDASDDDSEDLPWAASPVRHTHPLQSLPADSSPPRSSGISTHPTTTRRKAEAGRTDGSWESLASSLHYGSLHEPSASRPQDTMDVDTCETVNGRPMSSSSSRVSDDVAPTLKVEEYPKSLPVPRAYGDPTDFDSSQARSDASLPMGSPRTGTSPMKVLKTTGDETNSPPTETAVVDFTFDSEDVQSQYIEAQVPSTALNLTEPFTQVRRTPYVNGYARNNASKLNEASPGRESTDGSQSPEFVGNSAPTQREETFAGSGKILLQESGRDQDQASNSRSSMKQTSDDLDRKRKQDPLLTNFSTNHKRLKFSDWMSDQNTQDEEELVSPALLADKNRREFFERRDSAGSLQTSTPVSPAHPHKISHATFQSLAPIARTRSSFSGLNNEAKTPSRLRLSPLRLDTAISTSKERPVVEVTKASAKMVEEDAHPGAQAISKVEKILESRGHDTNQASTTDSGLPIPQITEQIKEPAQLNVIEGTSENLPVADRTRKLGVGPESSPLEHQTRAVSDHMTLDNMRKHDHASLDMVVDVPCGSPSAIFARSDSPTKPSPTHPSPSRTLDKPSPNHPGQQASEVEKMTSETQHPKRVLEGKDTTSEASNPPGQPLTLYQQFQRAYAQYKGNEKHFRSLCTKLSRILEGGALVPSYLLDDFVIRHKTEYQIYLHQCADEGEDPESYEKYYMENISDAVFTKRIINRHSLLTEFGTGQIPKQPVFERSRAGGVDEEVGKSELESPVTSTSGARLDSAVSTKPHTPQILRAASPEIQMSASSSMSKSRRSSRTQVQSKDPITIDLTLDDDSFEPAPPSSARVSKSKANDTPKRPRVLPWEKPTASPKTSGSQSAPRAMPLRSIGPTGARPRDRISVGGASTARITNLDGPQEIIHGKASASSIMNDTPLHKDPSSPYNQWKRHMDAVTPSKGNSFATEEQKQRGREIQQQRVSIRQSKLKH